MTDDSRQDEIDRLVADHLAGIESPSFASETARSAEVADLLHLADLLWDAAHGAPPLERDPVAAMLGLVPDSSRSLDGAALKRALQASGLKVSELAGRLHARGWDVATRDVFNWQSKSTTSVAPAMIQAIAEITGAAAEKLTVDQGADPSHASLRAVTSSKPFQALAERWARLRGTTLNLGASALEARLAASVFRGETPDEDRMIASLEALVSALESEANDDGNH